MTRVHVPLFSLLLTCGIVQAGEQIITLQSSPDSVEVGEVVQVDIQYTTANPEDTTLTGIGIRLHWDSAKLDYQGLISHLAANPLAQGEPETDTADFDADPNTDTFIHLAWADIDENWPNLGPTPVDLFTAEFIASWPTTSTTMNVSSSATATGYAFSGTSTGIAVGCTGSHINLNYHTILTGETLTCVSTGDIVFGPGIEQQMNSTVELTATTGIAISAPLRIVAGAVFKAIQGGL